MIQTMNFDNILKGRNFDMDSKAITSPQGTAPINVMKNHLNVCRTPLFNAPRTIGICSMIRSILLLFCFYFYYSCTRAACTPYFSAHAFMLPSAVAFAKNSSRTAARSEPLRKPTPYFSLFRATV